MIATNDEDKAKWLRAARDHGITKGTEERYKKGEVDYSIDFVGFREKSDDVHAAIGIEQLKKLPWMTDARNNVVKRYNSLAGTLNEEDTINCSLCKNKGFIAKIRRYGDSIERVLVECECQTQRRTIRKLKKLGYDLDFNNKTFETFKTPEKWQKEYKELALDYVKNGDKNWPLIS